MSTTKRLAKRSIIGTRVCAPGPDGKYYCGVISAVNTPASPHQPEPQGGLNITPDTRYSVRFDPVPASYCQGKPPDNKAEFSDRDLIGPGFGSVTSARLLTGQRVFLTYNGREIQAEVVQHREHLDEVDVVFAAPSGQEGTISLTKRIDEVRLLESRKSARLADSDTDFARLADMGSDRKRASSNSIDVPHVIGSRKRRPSSSNDSERSYNGNQLADSGSYMDECSAAMVLMSLSTPPKNPLPIHCQQHYGSWDDGVSTSSNRVVVGSPGVGGTSNSSSSSSTSSGASYRSGTPSPPLSDEGNVLWPSSSNGSSASSSMANSAPLNHHHPHHSHPHLVHHPHPAHSQRYYQYHQPIHHHHQQADGSSSSSPNFTYDEGIVPDLDLDRPRKKRIRCRVNYDDCTRDSPNAGSSSDNEVKPMTIYRCTWRTGENRNIRCGETGSTWEVVAEHVLRTHLNGQNTTDHEEDFYIVDEQLEPACSPPTKSHWDMVRPRSEDPEYQKQLRLAASPNNQNTQSSAAVNTQDIIIRDVFSISSQNSPSKQFKPAPRPALQAYNPQNISVVTVSLGKMPHSPRRVRGETKKCRKVYGMEHKELWCTQCKWKKACTRFND